MTVKNDIEELIEKRGYQIRYFPNYLSDNFYPSKNAEAYTHYKTKTVVIYTNFDNDINSLIHELAHIYLMKHLFAKMKKSNNIKTHDKTFRLVCSTLSYKFGIFPFDYWNKYSPQLSISPKITKYLLSKK